MYIDKRVKDHNLLQTIARVNRVAKGKTRGYIVDYIGLTDHLKEALSIYAADDQKELAGSLQNITDELPTLESRYRRLVNLFTEHGVADIEGFAQQTITDPKQTYDDSGAGRRVAGGHQAAGQLRGLPEEVPAKHGHHPAAMRQPTRTRSPPSGSASCWSRSRNGTRTTR